MSSIASERPRFSVDRAAWRAALACMLALAVAMGIGRFAFTPLLPMMLRDHWVTIRGGSWLASLNYAGYFVGALSCMIVRASSPRMIRLGLAATVVLTLGMGLLHDYTLWAVLRTAAGIASAWVMVFSASWGLQRLAELQRPALAGYIFAGPGVGIVVTGLAGSGTTAAGGGAQSGWLVCGVLAVLLSALIWRVFSDEAPALASGSRPSAAAATAQAPGERGEEAWLVLLYGLAGFGYIITATFLPVIAREALPGSPWPDLFWPLLGLAVIPGSVLAASVRTRLDNRLLLAGLYVMQALGIIIGIVWPTVAGFALGSVLVGVPFTALVLFAMREARRIRGNSASSLMGLMTAVYGIGQIAGPLVAAPLVAHTGSFIFALLLAAATLLIGAAGYVVVWRRAMRHAD